MATQQNVLGLDLCTQRHGTRALLHVHWTMVQALNLVIATCGPQRQKAGASSPATARAPLDWFGGLDLRISRWIEAIRIWGDFWRS